MPLTPEDVKNKRFTPVRLREGYDMGEVDQFLDEVEAELDRLYAENTDLRNKLESAATAAPSSGPMPTRPSEQTHTPEPVAQAPAVHVPAAQDAHGVPGETQPGSERDASGAAARLLELATTNADQLVTEAKNQADQILAEARTKSERVESEARAKAERLEAEARSRSGRLDAETEQRRGELFGKLESDKDNLTRELEDLRAFEREYRSRLKAYFEAQLRSLNGEAGGEEIPLTPSGNSETPRRLRELLGDDDEATSAATS
jgi:DivIVA domain-containing protein